MQIHQIPTPGVVYFVSDIPDIILVRMQAATTSRFVLTCAGVTLHDEVYTYGVDSYLHITGIAAMVAASLLVPLTPYTFNYTIYTADESNYSNSFQAKKDAEITVDSEPETDSLYFQKNIPDIFISKNGYDSITFELKNGGDVVLTETYVFDIDNKIQIRNIGEIIEKYFSNTILLLNCSYTITQGITDHSNSFKVLKCEADMTVNASSWTAENFLTRSYREKRTSKSRNEYLSFLQKVSYGEVFKNYRVVYYSEDHWTEKTVTVGPFDAVVSDQITTFNASMAAIMTAAELDPVTEVMQCDVWLTGTDFQTAVYTFLNDFNIYRNRKHFVFVNSFGVLETFTATGRSDVKKSGEFNLGNIQSRYRKITQDFIAETAQYSGFLWESEMEWIDDLLLSYNVSTYTPGVTGSDEEITLTGFDKTDTDANELEGFSFTYRKAKNSSIQFVNAAKGIFDDTFDNTFN